MAVRQTRFVAEAAVVLLALAIALLAHRGLSPRGAPEPTHASAQVRGLAPHLEIYREADGTVAQLWPGDVVRPGEVIQVRYVAAGFRYGVVVSVDGRGHTTLHHPAAADAVPKIEARGQTPLAHAFELDDAPGFERFFFVTGPVRSLEVGAVLEAAHRLARAGVVAAREEPLPLPKQLTQCSFLLRK